MKFSCPKCAAKYQIADEKVKGRTVKMKCRKCGTTIPIRAQGDAKSPIASAPVVRADSLRPAPAKKAPVKAPVARGVAQKPAAKRPAPKTAARPVAQSPATRAAAKRPVAKPSPAAKASPAAQASPAAVAPAPAAAQETDPEWHAGIAGKAVGPMSIREMERRIGDGEINEETYVWREGMGEWKPIPEVPELKPVLTRSLPPLAAPPPSMPAPAKAQAPAIVGLAAAPAAAVAATPAAAATPVAVAGLAAPAPASGPVASDPIINEAPEPAGWSNAMEGLDEKGTAAVAATAAPPAGEAPAPKIDMPSADEPRAHSYDSLVMQLQKKRKNPLAVPFAVLAALIFGVTVGFVLFGDQKTKIVKQIVEVPTKVEEAMHDKRAAEVEASVEQSAPPEKPEIGTQQKPTAVAAKGTTKSAGSSTKSGASGKAPDVKGLSGLQGLDGLGGPSGGPSGPSANAGGGRPLSSGQIQSTVSKYRTSVKRGCWERALMMRDKNAPSSARVSVSITVAASGSVTGASSGGDPKGYSGLSSCITRRVRGWKFPRGSGVTTVNVPFVFAAQ